MPAKQTKTETASATTQPKVAEKAPKTPKTAKPAAVTEPAAKSAKVSKKKEAAPKVAEVVAASTEGAAATESVPAEVSSVSGEFTGFMTKLQQLSAMISSLKTEFRTLEKKASRELKIAAKASSKRKRKTGNRAPSGFVKPTLISDELASFLGKDKGTQMARTEVTREINAYIRTNQLQDKTNGRRINADVSLASLLKLNSGEELTYFNLQRYMSPHFAKSGAAAPATAL